MPLTTIIKILADAFNTCERDLNIIFTKTNFEDRDEVLHAVAMAWNYPRFYPAHDRAIVKSILDSVDDRTNERLAIAAKNGFGAFCE